MKEVVEYHRPNIVNPNSGTTVSQVRQSDALVCLSNHINQNPTRHAQRLLSRTILSSMPINSLMRTKLLITSDVAPNQTQRPPYNRTHKRPTTFRAANPAIRDATLMLPSEIAESLSVWRLERHRSLIPTAIPIIDPNMQGIKLPSNEMNNIPKVSKVIAVTIAPPSCS